MDAKLVGSSVYVKGDDTPFKIKGTPEEVVHKIESNLDKKFIDLKVCHYNEDAGEEMERTMYVDPHSVNVVCGWFKTAAELEGE